MTNEAVLHGTQRHVLRSEAVGDDYEITVLAPPREMSPGPTPVVIGTDANMLIGLYTDVIGQLMVGGEMPAVTLVGVGYPTGRDYPPFLQKRIRDFTPVPDRWAEERLGQMVGREITGGGAPAFLRFLTTELKPWLQARFPVSDDVTYVGHSGGGLFGAHVLLSVPQTFSRYLLMSPVIWWGTDDPLREEGEYAMKHVDLPARVFLTAGGSEDVISPLMPPSIAEIFSRSDCAAHTSALTDRLRARGYPSLDLVTRIFPEETHFTVPAFGVAHGLRSLFKRERLARSDS